MLSGLQSFQARLRDRVRERRSAPFFPKGSIVSTCRSLGDFQAMSSRIDARELQGEEDRIAVAGKPFTVAGFCTICLRRSRFHVGWEHSFEGGDGHRRPNWREHLACGRCRLNNRMRAAAAFMMSEAPSDTTLYLSEQTTPLYQVLSRRFRTIGSEFLRDGTPEGATNADGIRHEDLTQLTLGDSSVSRIGCFDVLEHVPAYEAALREMRRILQPGGKLLLSVPFDFNSQSNIRRASLMPDGRIEHHLPPEYHGDPLDPAGVLCFYHFGWDLLEELRQAGFADARQMFYRSRRYGHLGGTQALIQAEA